LKRRWNPRGKNQKGRAVVGAIKKSKGSSRSTVSSSSPLGLLGLYLLEQWRKSGRNGTVFLSENEDRAERLGSVLHSLDPSLDVLVFPRLIEEAAARKDAEREYLRRDEWKKLTKRMSVLPRKAAFRATPDFSKLTSPRKALRAFVADTQRAGSRLLFVAAVEDDLRAMERMSGMKVERFSDRDQATGSWSREGAFVWARLKEQVSSGRVPCLRSAITIGVGSFPEFPKSQGPSRLDRTRRWLPQRFLASRRRRTASCTTEISAIRITVWARERADEIPN
jgi:hypothetical protein